MRLPVLVTITKYVKGGCFVGLRREVLTSKQHVARRMMSFSKGLLIPCGTEPHVEKMSRTKCP